MGIIFQFEFVLCIDSIPLSSKPILNHPAIQRKSIILPIAILRENGFYIFDTVLILLIISNYLHALIQITASSEAIIVKQRKSLHTGLWRLHHKIIICFFPQPINKRLALGSTSKKRDGRRRESCRCNALD